MKKFISLSIAIVSLSLLSCREQDDMVKLNDTNNLKASKQTTPDNSAKYGNFNSSTLQQGDPTKPPKD